MKTTFHAPHATSDICNKKAMASLKNEQKKSLAKEIYLLGSYTLEEIASKVGTTRQTVGRWAKSEGWDELKAGMTITREQILKNMYRQIDEINSGILQREAGQRFANAKEADILAKLAAAIDKMEREAGLADMVSVGMRFCEWLRKADIDMGKQVASLWDAFLKDSIN